MALSTYLANRLLDLAIGKTAFTLPTVHVALFITNPTAAGSGTEASWTGYARVAAPGASWSAATGSASNNAAAITQAGPKTAGADATVGFWATYDAATLGNLLEFGALVTPQLVSNGTTINIPIGSAPRSAS